METRKVGLLAASRSTRAPTLLRRWCLEDLRQHRLRQQAQRNFRGIPRRDREQLQIMALKSDGDLGSRQQEGEADMFGLGGPGYKTALDAATTAGNTGAGYGTQAATASSALMPFLERNLETPQGFTQQQMGAKLGAAEGGAGGSTAGLTTEANLATARDRNSGGFAGSLDQAAREKDKALAGTSEGIAGENADLQQQQQQNAAKGLAGEQGMDQDAQLKAMGLIPEDVNAATKAYGVGDWASDLGQLQKGVNAGIGTLGSVARFAGGFI